jgi:hypothetical protein
MWKAAVAAAVFACGVQSACSPYVFSDNVQNLSAKMGSIDASYQDNAQKIVAERHLGNRTLWIHEKPVLLTGPGCDLDAANSVPCDLIAKGAPLPTVHTAAKPEPIAPTANVCETITDLPAAPTPSAPTPSEPTTGSDKHPPPLQRADLLRALDNYTAALAAITKAQDRADFDNAAAKVSAAVGALAQSAPGPYGAAAAPVAKASTNAVLWLVGQDLDYRRLHELQNATGVACEPMHVLADALGVVLEEQRDARLRGLFVLLVRKTQALNRARAAPRVTDQAYGAAIDDAEAAADAFQTVRATNPHATARALSDAHDELVMAVRNNDGEFTALVAGLQTFTQRANDLAAAAAANASVPSSTEKKS